jgi:hypothetical protein
MSADGLKQFSDYRKAEHFASYCNFHGIKQRKDSGSVFDFMGGDAHSDREKALLQRYEKYGASWRLWANPSFWDHKLKQQLLEFGRAGLTRSLWATLLRREALEGADYRAELESFLRDNNAWIAPTDSDREWLAVQEEQAPGFYAPPPPPES